MIHEDFDGIYCETCHDSFLRYSQLPKKPPPEVAPKPKVEKHKADEEVLDGEPPRQKRKVRQVFSCFISSPQNADLVVAPSLRSSSVRPQNPTRPSSPTPTPRHACSRLPTATETSPVRLLQDSRSSQPCRSLCDVLLLDPSCLLRYRGQGFRHARLALCPVLQRRD